jgi:Domain of unknown function (DUF4381)
MNEAATSLDRLHDIVLPPAVPWWPPAPGWYVLFAFILLVAALLGWRIWKHWQANAYRRAALRELRTLQDAPAIAELLRRTALAVVPRHVIATKAGAAWVDWMAMQSGEAMSPEVRELLTAGVYGRQATDRDVDALRDFARGWIARHHLVPPEKTEGEGHIRRSSQPESA